ncbi:MAG: tetratricopeptide repeat protein [Herpetosiphonaceae bacterium]|nr:tetratricopeptide repeat protein [Herpetosiphonaceae bacterium]
MPRDTMTFDPALIRPYLPSDRYAALRQGIPLPERAPGAVLFADIAGFTALTAALAAQFGMRRGAEEVTRQIDAVYTALIGVLDRYGGSVVGFSGDAITCWVDNDDGWRATCCALAMQTTMATFAALPVSDGTSIALTIKVAVASGSVRRFLVGDPAIQHLDVLAGATLERLAQAEALARSGEVVLDAATAQRLAGRITIGAWRDSAGGPMAVVAGSGAADPLASTSTPLPDLAPDGSLNAWLLPAVAARLRAGNGEFVTELRPAVALFLAFDGIDFEHDEAARDQLNAFICWIQGVVARYEGTLIQLTIGDKGSYLYIAFGAPIIHEDDPERAIRAALELRAPSMALGIQPVRIGISAGIMRTGTYGGSTRRSYGVLGDAVNVAARLMQHARPGQIAVHAHLRQLIGPFFKWEAAQTIQVKGKQDSITFYLLDDHHDPSAMYPSQVFYSLPMIGRETELAAVVAQSDLAKQGQGRIVRICADAGMGKSRLVAEVIHQARRQGLLIHTGACHSYAINTAYHAWYTIWSAFFGIERSATRVEQVQMLEQTLERTNPLLRTRLPLLGSLLNMPIPDNEITQSLDAKVRKEALEGLLIECLRVRGKQLRNQHSALIIVIEDGHWMDGLSHDLLKAIEGAIHDLPILLLLTYRPTELIQFKSLDATLQQTLDLQLGPFTAAETRKLVMRNLAQWGTDTTQAITKSVVDTLMKRADGNPFYIEELLRYLHEHGLNSDPGQGWQSIDLPNSLHSLILSRIDHLSEKQQITLKVSSIIGQMFRADWLWEYYPLLGSAEQVIADLEHLSRLDITVRDLPKTELMYLFKHIITQEVIYESLAYTTRATLHDQFARYLEMTLGDTTEQFVDMLAYHYERSDNISKKCEYLRKAGEAAQALYANADAISYYQRLLPLVDDRPDQIDIRFKLGAVQLQAGEYLAALESFNAGLRLLRSCGPSQIEAEARILRHIATVHERRAHYDIAFEHVDEAIQLIGEADSIERLRALLLGAGLHHRQGRYTETIRWAVLGLALAQKLACEPEQAKAYNLIGGYYRILGYLEQAIHYFYQSTDIYRALNNISGLADTYNNLIIVFTDLGDFQQAISLADEAYEMKLLINDIYGQAMILSNTGDAYRKMNNIEKSIEYSKRCLLLWDRLGSKLGSAVSHMNLGASCLLLNDYPAAEKHLAQSRLIFDEINIETYLAEWYRIYAELSLNSSRYEQALEFCDSAIAFARKFSSKAEEGLAELLQSQVLQQYSQSEQAFKAAQRALSILQACANNADVLKCLNQLMVLTASHDPGLSREYTAQANLIRRSLAVEQTNSSGG